jgi:hypothetical protein
MKCLISLISALVVFAFFYLIFPRKAYAYLDPGTGSYILQLITATLFMGLFAVKLFWNNVKIFFKNLFSRGKEPQKEHEKAED